MAFLYSNPENSRQVIYNYIATKYEEGYFRYLYEYNSSVETRVNHCQAWFVETKDWIILKSYSTIVAIYCKKVDTLYSVGRFSSTTYQHIRKFRNNYCPSSYMTGEMNLELVNWYK